MSINQNVLNLENIVVAAAIQDAGFRDTVISMPADSLQSQDLEVMRTSLSSFGLWDLGAYKLKLRSLTESGLNHDIATDCLTRKTVKVPEFEYAFNRVMEAYVERRKKAILQSGLEGKNDVTLVITELNTLISSTTPGGKFEHIYAIAQSRAKEINRVRQSGVVEGWLTGIDELDEYIGSFMPGMTICIGGRPGMGKTAIALGIANNIAKTGKPCYFISLEMSKERLTDRVISALTGIPVLDMIRGRITDEQMASINVAKEKLANRNIYFLDGEGKNEIEMIATIENAFAMYGKGPFFLDFIQNAKVSKDGGSNTNDKLDTIVLALKELGKRSAVAQILLSQLNRLSAQRATKDKRPNLTDLRGSGSIEQSSDVILFPFRPEYYGESKYPSGYTELIVAKNKDGQTGIIQLVFQAQTMSFFSLSQLPAPLKLKIENVPVQPFCPTALPEPVQMQIDENDLPF